ncbi:hypothetical protein BX600DRAFT_308294 [Xylariales sp. PMI_506]|nr:hypothetical protein BX600DRAFT_308294 [Xylariales sp. PMI_506]
MFGSAKRHRQQPHQQLNSSTMNPHASTAAAAAFMASSQNPNKSLSSAAAAAALRARPHTPTNVAQVQTKRTMRRTPSISSAGSAAAATGGNHSLGLRRRDSSSSMTERTFRSPSPRGDRRPAPQEPPVPEIPAGHRVSRSTSSVGVGMQTFRTASQKLESGMPSWYTQPHGDVSNVRTSDAPMASKQRPKSTSVIPQRSESRSSSINFSYPGRARAQSPPASPTTNSKPEWSQTLSRLTQRASVNSSANFSSGKALVYDPNSRRMVPKAELDAIEYRVKGAADRQPKKKRISSGIQRSGSHLAKGTVARLKGTIVESGREDYVPPQGEPADATRRTESVRTPEEQKRILSTAVLSNGKPSEVLLHVRSPEPRDSRIFTPSPTPPRDDSDYTASSLEANKLASHSSAPVEEQPEEEREEEKAEEEDDEDEDEDEDEDSEPTFMPSQEVLDALDAVPTRRASHETQPVQTPSDGMRPASSEDISEQSQHQDQVPEPYGSNVRDLQSEHQYYVTNKPVAELARENGEPRRSTSISPVRQARFAPNPSEQLIVRHTPLPRSASPIKSALKHSSPSPRDVSPSDNGSDIGGSRAFPADREHLPRKKAVRVSFDERSPIIVGESAPAEDSAPSSQQTRRPWYSNIGRNKKKDFELEDDEVMKPRPALPSFGSVRDKKNREPVEERPLIRPHEPALSPVPSSIVATPFDNATITEPKVLGQSSDQALGGLLAANQASSNEANISRYREPLPPVVTSLEGNGELSDETSESEEEFVKTIDDNYDPELSSTRSADASRSEMQTVQALPEATMQEETVSSDVPQYYLEPTSSEIPSVQVIQPTPSAIDETEVEPYKEYFDVPGMFPESNDSEDSPLSHTTDTFSKSAANAMKEPESAALPSQAQSLPQTTLVTTHVGPLEDMFENKSDKSDNDSIYSDAYEEIPEADGDGYLSLDAVVESPISKTFPSQGTESPTSKQLKKVIEDFSTVTYSAAAPPTANFMSTSTSLEPEWEQVKTYWRSLTEEKRRQLEQEALEDAGADGDEEDLKTPVRRLSNRTKKTLQQKQATGVAQLAKSQAEAAEAPRLQHPQPINLERVYMIQPGAKATHGPISPTTDSRRMRQSLRSEPSKPVAVAKSNPGDVHMRRSMRTNPVGIESSHHSTQERAGSQSIPTSKSAPGIGTSRQTALQGNTKTASVEIAATAATASSRLSKSTPKRRGSDASDSSFRRSRASNGDSFFFPRTMRRDTAPSQSPEATRGSSRFSLRSLSPTGSAFRRTAAPPVAISGMRRTLRSGSDSSHESKRSALHFPSFGRSNKSASKASGPRARRFDDSSDDEEHGPKFNSRFVDSSDEDDVRPSSSSKPLTRGSLRNAASVSTLKRTAATPVPEENEDSPDLPDSDDEEPSMLMPSPMQSPNGRAAFRPASHRSNSGIGTSTIQRSGSGRAALATSPATPVVTGKRSSSFMGNILRRNKRADPGKISRSELAESAARRDTKFERSVEQLRDIRGDGRPISPKLQKRAALSRGGSWPLPEGANDGRPSTANGRIDSTQVTRPALNDRRSTSLGLPSAMPPPKRLPPAIPEMNGTGIGEVDGVEPAVNGVQPVKKKKFGTLRKIFRLDD